MRTFRNLVFWKAFFLHRWGFSSRESYWKTILQTAPFQKTKARTFLRQPFVIKNFTDTQLFEPLMNGSLPKTSEETLPLPVPVDSNRIKGKRSIEEIEFYNYFRSNELSLPIKFCPINAKRIPAEFLQRFSEIKKKLGIQRALSELFFITKTPGVTYTHCECMDNYFIQLSGRKKWRLISPDQTAFVYMSPDITTKGGYFHSLVDHGLADKNIYTNLSKIHYLDIELEPGDLLYVPPFWWHEVRWEGPTLSISYFRRSFLRAFANHFILALLAWRGTLNYWIQASKRAEKTFVELGTEDLTVGFDAFRNFAQSRSENQVNHS